MDEIWKDIIGYEDYYQVSNKGNIRSKDRWYNGDYLKNKPIIFRKGVDIKPIPNKYGYLTVCLKKHSKGKTIPVHKLVATAFIEKTISKTCIDHINGDRTDNRVENLRWVTIKENQNNPITKRRLSECKIGTKHHFYGKKLSKEHSKKIGNSNRNGKCSIPIIQLELNGNFVNEYPSTNEAERQTGILHGNIWRAVKRQLTAGGYRWVYKRDYKR
nr:MAG TPA: homing endonuclease [Caudoviricetes sp.]